MSNKSNNSKEWILFYVLLNERGFCSQLSGLPLEGKITSRWFYFIYPKSKFPELRYCPDNIVIIADHEHEEAAASELIMQKAATIGENYEELKSLTKDYENTYLNPIFEHAKKSK